jgi:hypothetical protein
MTENERTLTEKQISSAMSAALVAMVSGDYKRVRELIEDVLVLVLVEHIERLPAE